MRILEFSPGDPRHALASTALALGLACGAGCSSGRSAAESKEDASPEVTVAALDPEKQPSPALPSPPAKTAIGGLEVGARAPEFTLDAHDGAPWRLAEYTAKGPVVVVFYRGDWCPKCRGQLEELQARRSDFEGRDATVVALSVDGREKNRALAARLELEFPLLADPELTTIRAYEVEHGGEDIARPAVYVIGRDRKVRWAWVGENPADRPPIDTILQALDAGA